MTNSLPTEYAFIAGYSDPFEFITDDLKGAMVSAIEDRLDKLRDEMTAAFSNANPETHSRIIEESVIQVMRDWLN